MKSLKEALVKKHQRLWRRIDNMKLKTGDLVEVEIEGVSPNLIWMYLDHNEVQQRLIELPEGEFLNQVFSIGDGLLTTADPNDNYTRIYITPMIKTKYGLTTYSDKHKIVKLLGSYKLNFNDDLRQVFRSNNGFK